MLNYKKYSAKRTSPQTKEVSVSGDTTKRYRVDEIRSQRVSPAAVTVGL